MSEEKKTTSSRTRKPKIDEASVVVANDVQDEPTPVEVQEPLRMDEKISIRNLAPWLVGFRRFDSSGDLTLQPGGTIRVTRSEVLAQVQNGNRLLSGLDGMGSHATIFIDDKATRQFLDFDNEYRTQAIISEKKVKDLFAIADDETFMESFKATVVTRFEKQFVRDTIKKLNLDKSASFSKMHFALDHCRFKLM